MARVKTKEERIRSEKTRLNKQYKELAADKRALAAGLIEQAAFLRVELADLAENIRENGWTEPFQQAKGMEPYDRARPQGQAYQSAVANYQKSLRSSTGFSLRQPSNRRATDSTNLWRSVMTGEKIPSRV